MDFIVVSEMTFDKVSLQEAEIVERKGIGHPDTICDSLAEELSVELSKLYIKELGAIMHHNVDKALLVGGKAHSKFGGGEVVSPIEIFLVGRALREIDGKEFPVDELAIDVAHNWLKKHIRNLDSSKHVILQTRIKPGSKDLVELFDRFQKKGEVPLSNDTSFGVGFAPFSELENIVFYTEKLLNSEEIKNKHPEVGEDIKVMGVRIKDNIRITVSAAFVDKYVKNINQYKEQKEAITNLVLENARKYTDKNVNVFVNTADDIENESVYITVTGTSSEQGDDGQVGRGNRANGLITPYRPMSLEAAAGKNPVSHIGKIYNVVANIIANRVVKEVEGVEEAYCYMVSQIGKPINEPQVCDVKVRKKGNSFDKEAVRKIAQEELEKMPNTWKLFLEKEFSVA
ncbi:MULTISPECIES: methionine adenosyltransferase [unclassified Hydrogenobaculum]|uniref:methionine adenosyltransferase n=1 Tax=unclassified Hydrogenobaculum TaxID=2622382 RepID=UPI0001C502F0|nr:MULTISPECIES: methionine adenosyltransferase [unclassified Hydrogenobaculum]AEF19129.1 Methionine adenosyltransferase [Hydrogenobaculum sp. 3684]AEG46418.1 Methionine adenosyltransferase [Hydrogenobaculum sp. SHO]AGG15062.1 Methionine adenosyltransferase [Hydrogenobaculum sp. HO]AGH93359.1 archaeal S-adenosylmethionine synthetase [Hydrogenobaculum sp. SN]